MRFAGPIACGTGHAHKARAEDVLKANFSTPEHLRVAIVPGVASTTVQLTGRVDIESSPDLRDQLLSLLKTQSSVTIKIDLAEVPYIDTSGVATLIEALKIARHRKNALCLEGLTGSVLHFFEVTGVLTLFNSNQCSAASSALTHPQVS
jgi:anti-sigma B factor antagonist